jgi:uncharacterized membrane protein YtjA (UPF0391 family)
MGLLGWALVFLTVVGVAAIFGFSGIASAAAGIAKVLFFIFVAIFVGLLILGSFGVGEERTKSASSLPQANVTSLLRGSTS